MEFIPEKSFLNKIISLEKFVIFLIVLEFILLVFLFFSVFYKYFSLGICIFAVILLLKIIERFFLFLQKIEPKDPLSDFVENPEIFNVFDFLDFRSFKLVKNAIKKVKNLGIGEIPYPLLAFYLIEGFPKYLNSFVIARTLIDFKKYNKELKNFIIGIEKGAVKEIDFGNLKELFVIAAQIAQKRGNKRISPEDIFSALVYLGSFLKGFFISRGLKPKDIERTFDWYQRIQKRVERRKDLLDLENLKRIGSVGGGWSSGFTPILDSFSHDITYSVRGVDFDDFPGHDDELRQMERILSKKANTNDVLLVGVPGSFRRNVIRKLALKMALGLTDDTLKFKRLVELKLGLLASGAQSKEGLEKTLGKIFREVVSAGNIVLIIDNFHAYFDVESNSNIGTPEISGILTSFLRLKDFQLIGITTYRDYYRVFDKKIDFLAYFEKVEVDEFKEDETIEILENRAMILELEYKKIILYKTIRDIVYFCDKYLADAPFPQKAINLLEETFVYTSQNTQSPLVLSDHAAEIIQQKTEIPVGKLEVEERRKLLDLENLIHQQIINQEQAVVKIAEALRRARSGISIKKGPIGTFLFLGPTGVGKTETAKALAKIYFGGEKRMIRFDMSEFQKKEDIDRLLGSPRDRGRLVEEMKNNPFSLVLFDEVEKAHPDILNLFLQILDEGFCHDALGNKISFEHSMIIATSNAGYKIILEAIAQNKDFAKIETELLDYLFESGIFRPEFVNRFDNMVVFRPLTKENLIDIAELLLTQLQRNLRNKEISFTITKELKESVVELGYNPIFGAREMKRVIQDKIEDVMAEALLSEELRPGDSIKISPVDFKIIKVEGTTI
ncbi:MAG: ATP-dependent Clp protease ATP-binding subunit [bacterium]|nr:ATP-dependent Clp protease ATP-binding subunit [bacterium]